MEINELRSSPQKTPLLKDEGGSKINSLSLAEEANSCLSVNDLAGSVKFFEAAIARLSIESKENQVLAKAKIDEYLSSLSVKERHLALKMAKKVIKANPGWMRGWRRVLLLSLPHVMEDCLRKYRMAPIDVLERTISINSHSRTPIAVTTRAFNRLEYTIQCVDGVAQQASDTDFIHVVIDQASDDGTEQWFNWLWQNPKPYWSRLGYIRLKQNLGDWGGIILAQTIIADKYRRVMQLDNDMQLLDSQTLNNMSFALDILGENNIVMCRRLKAGDLNGATGGDVPLLPLSRSYKLELSGTLTKIYRVNHAVGCYLASRELVDAAINARCTAACRICDALNQNSKVYKLHDVPALHIQGWDGKRYLQHEKYYKGSVSAGMNYLHLSSEEIMNNPKQFIDYTLPPACDCEWLKK